MSNFTPISALIGGLLIGLASACLLLLHGRVAGISGILGGLLRPKAQDWGWRLSFILGMLFGAHVFWKIDLGPNTLQISSSWVDLVLAGALVGYGSSLGSGCTSGHGICGISRLSTRSIVATLCFMGMAFITYFLTRHIM